MPTDSTSAVETIRKVLIGAGLGFGVAGVLNPRTLTAAYGMHEQGPDTTYMNRLWATRQGALGVLMLLTSNGPAERRAWFVTSAGMGAVDLVIALTTPGVSSRTRVMGALTSGGFGAAAGYAALRTA